MTRGLKVLDRQMAINRPTVGYQVERLVRKNVNRGIVMPAPIHQDETEKCPVKPSNSILEWLEKEDGPVSLAVGYIISGITFAYLVGQLIRVIIR